MRIVKKFQNIITGHPEQEKIIELKQRLDRLNTLYGSRRIIRLVTFFTKKMRKFIVIICKIML